MKGSNANIMDTQASPAFFIRDSVEQSQDFHCIAIRYLHLPNISTYCTITLLFILNQKWSYCIILQMRNLMRLWDSFFLLLYC